MSHNVHRRQQPERIEIFIFSGLSLPRPVDTKTEFNLNNIIATLSLISISSVKKNSPANVLKLGLNSTRWMLASVAAERVTKSPDYTSFVCLRRRLDECQSWWASTLRAMPPLRHNLCALRLVERQLTSFPLRHWNLRNLTLQQECYLTSTGAFNRTFARLYNAAASPASRLRSAGSLAIIECRITQACCFRDYVLAL